MNRTIAYALASGLLATASIAPANAQEMTRVVSYADLDLTQAAGVHALENRVRDAVSQVCGDANIRDLPAYNEMKACRASAMDRARSQISLATSHAQQRSAARSVGSDSAQISAR